MNKLFTVIAILFSMSALAEYVEFTTGQQTLITNNKEAGFLLTNKEAEPLIEVLDKDNDGIVDLLRYTVFDSAGSAKLIVEDNDLDGHIDQKWYKGKAEYFEIPYDGVWYRVKKSKSEKYIETTAGKLPVKLIGGILRVTHNKSKQQGPSGGTH